MAWQQGWLSEPPTRHVRPHGAAPRGAGCLAAPELGERAGRWDSAPGSPLPSPLPPPAGERGCGTGQGGGLGRAGAAPWELGQVTAADPDAREGPDRPTLSCTSPARPRHRRGDAGPAWPISLPPTRGHHAWPLTAHLPPWGRSSCPRHRIPPAGTITQCGSQVHGPAWHYFVPVKVNETFTVQWPKFTTGARAVRPWALGQGLSAAASAASAPQWRPRPW